jgi:hypothetical protein
MHRRAGKYEPCCGKRVGLFGLKPPEIFTATFRSRSGCKERESHNKRIGGGDRPCANAASRRGWENIIQKKPNYLEYARYPWEAKYLAAILETDDTKLPERVADANSAISARLEIMKKESSTAEEQQAISKALGSLKRVIQERLGKDSSS